MPYVTLDNLRGPDGYLDQQFTTDGEADESHDVALTTILARAEAAVNEYLGISTSLVGVTEETDPTEITVYGSGTRYLQLPSFVTGSVEGVTTLAGYTVPDYIEQSGYLVVTTSTGIITPTTPVYPSPFYSYSGVWQDGLPYTVEAVFGWSTGDMANLAQATLERAVQLWRYKDAGGSETIGAEGAITTVRTGWTPGTKQILDGIAKRVRGFSGGVW